jgi:anaerobic magnesium-protoporphyrin IX monomethyl ester cyclase
MTKDKVLIINEPFVQDFCRTQRWAARTRGRVLRAPDWLAYTAAVLEAERIEVGLYDFPAKGWDKQRLKDLVRQQQPAVVVLDSTTPSIYSDIDCAKICKEEADNPKVIMVGPHVSVLAEETLVDANGCVDAVAVGEYEYTVRDYAKAVMTGSNSYNAIPGLVWADSGRVVRNEPRPLIENLDELPFPAWQHLDLWDYFDGTKLYPYIDIIGGRGCPFRCVYCLWPQVMHGNQYRLRSAENIVEEIRWVLNKWPEAIKGEFFFEDDTFTVNKDRAHKLCDLLMKERRRCTWSVNVRADVTDVDLLKHMKSAGCRMLLVGFESGAQKMLDNMQKGLKVEKMVAFIKAAKSVGLQIHGCFVLGLPGETRETMEETLDFSLNNPLDTVQFSGAVPFPGTRYFEYVAKKGLLKAQKWDQWLNDGEQASVVDYPGLTKKEVDHYVDRGLKRFYFRPSYMVRFVLATRSKQDLYRKLRGAKNFLDYLLHTKA